MVQGFIDALDFGPEAHNGPPGFEREHGIPRGLDPVLCLLNSPYVLAILGPEAEIAGAWDLGYGRVILFEHLAHRAGMFEARANEAYAALSGIDGALVNRPCGAFYMTVVFEDGALHSRQSLKIENDAVRQRVEQLVVNGPNDQRFVYYLMGATGICVVPLSGFYCKRDGFRITLLECDDQKRIWTLETLAEALREYVSS